MYNRRRPLQWLWDGVKDFQTEFNDLSTRVRRNFRRPFDDERHDPNCGLKVNQAATPKKCSCCTGALTFQEAGYVKDQVTKISSDSDQDKKERHRVFKKVPWTASQGFENWKDLFGHGNDKESLSQCSAL